jgi:hypothetical protein
MTAPERKLPELVRDLVCASNGNELGRVYTSKDGGIDVIVEGIGLIAQCKYSAVRKTVASSDVNKLVNDAFKQLRLHLKDDAPTHGQSQYQIWYDPTLAKTYVFTINRACANEATRRHLIKAIKNQFQYLAGKHVLRHLRNIRVELLDEQDIERLLEAQPRIRIQWFGLPLPAGVETFDEWKRIRIGEEDGSKKHKFSSYLFPDGLAYQPHPDVTKRPTSTWVRLKEDENALAIIHGRGGTGKSRLAVEVAQLAQNDGWLVFVIRAKQLTINLLDTLSRTEAESKHLLFVDYAEGCVSLDDVVHRLKQIAEDGGVVMKMIATMRSLSTIGEFVEDEDNVAIINLTLSETESRLIVEGILGVEHHKLVPLCNGIPVLAAFLKLQITQGTVDVNLLRQEIEFQKWFHRHVVGAKPSIPILVRLCSMLSATRDQMSRAELLVAGLQAEKDRLLGDGWMIYADTEPDPWEIAHHLIVDVVIAEALSNLADRIRLVDDLLDFANQVQSQPQLLDNLQRIRTDDAVRKIDWANRFLRERATWSPYVSEIARTELVPLSKAIGWMIEMGFEKSLLASDASARAVIGKSLLNDARAEKRQLTPTEHDWLTATFESTTDVFEQALILSRWLRTANVNDETKANAAAWLTAHGGTQNAGFVYAAYLTAGGSSEVARKMFSVWFNANNIRHDALIPIVAWINSAADTSSVEIREAVTRWIEARNRALSTKAQFLYRAWLKNKGAVALVHTKMCDWLDKFRGKFEAQNVFNAWLEHHLAANRPPASLDDALKESVKHWMYDRSNHGRFDAHYTYASWLKAGDYPGIAKEPLATWMQCKTDKDTFFVTDFDAGRSVLTAWIQATNDTEHVQDGVSLWLDFGDNSKHIEALYVIDSWLNANGSTDFICNWLTSWLEIHGKRNDAEQLMSRWLKRRGAVGSIESHVLTWLAEHQDDGDNKSDFLISRWRNAGGSPLVVESAISRRSLRYGISNADYWCSTPNFEPDAVGLGVSIERQGYLASWIKSIAHDHIDLLGKVREILATEGMATVSTSAQILRFWIERHGVRGVAPIAGDLCKWMDAHLFDEPMTYVIPTVLELPGNHELSDFAKRVVAQTSELLRSRDSAPPKSDFYIYRAWVRSGRSLEPIVTFLEAWLLANRPLSATQYSELIQPLNGSQWASSAWYRELKGLLANETQD